MNMDTGIHQNMIAKQKNVKIHVFQYSYGIAARCGALTRKHRKQMLIKESALRRIIKEELARTGFGRLREGAGEEASAALSTYFEMPQFATLAPGVGDKLDDILNNKLIIKMGDKGPVVKVIQALVKGKLNQAMKHTSQAPNFGSTMGSGELGKAVTGLGEPDGDFGDKTRTAVMVLQKVMKNDAITKGAKQNSPELPTIDGAVGRQTLTFILGKHGGSVTGATAAPAARSYEKLLTKEEIIASLQVQNAGLATKFKINNGQLVNIINLADSKPHNIAWWLSKIDDNAQLSNIEISYDILEPALKQILPDTRYVSYKPGSYTKTDLPLPVTKVVQTAF
jgi:peptidoglycan hydrolase-like protein with peptidoglycan-binding domain